MQKDDSTAAEVWAGELPAVFVLARDEVTTHNPPLPFHICLPRQSYLPFVVGAILDYFRPFAPPLGGDEPWYECKTVPLRWQIPIGVLFDLLVGEQDGSELPWQLTIHFHGFSSATLMSSAGSAAESLVLNSLKESCYLMCGSSLPAMSLSVAEQKKLMISLSTNSYSQYAEVASRISAQMEAHLGESKLFRAVPVRAFTSPTEWRQQPATPNLPSGEATTVGDFLTNLLPTFFVRRGPNEASEDSSESAEPRVIVQGVQIPLDTPLLWLHSVCRHPDGFLYITCFSQQPIASSEHHPNLE